MKLSKILSLNLLIPILTAPVLSISSCKNNVAVTSITISGDNEAIVGSTKQYTATVLPENASNKNVVWTVDDTAKATISSTGILTPLAEGSVTIKCEAADGSKVIDSKKVTISFINVTSITISGDSEVSFGSTKQYTATVLPENASNKNVTWSVDDSTKASIDTKGLLTAKAGCSVTITCAANDGSKVSQTKTITIKQTYVTSIEIDGTSEATIGTNSQYTAKILPTDASIKNVKWSIDDSSIASISSDGLLTPIKEGSVTIKCEATDGSGISNTKQIYVIESYLTYIHDRSFSLMGIGQSSKGYSLCWGTCWIISDATPDTYDDYKYYIATNWHVVLGQQEVQSTTTNYKVCFGDDTSSSGLYPFRDYTQFTSYELENESNFCFDSTFSKSSLIDFYVAKADFSIATGSMKTKLDKLNSLQKEKGYITQFAPTTTDTQQYMTDTMYIGGFPVQNTYYATWETHEFKPTDVGMYYASSYSHSIDEDNTYIDISPQYIFNTDMGKSWMKGGASGSMLVGKFDHEYKICGIYWGGWTDSSKTVFYPAFSIFNSHKKNFISSYITK